uniref:Transcription factor IIIC 90kDa subunit N-terminal domain-containing protein n=1 Tax=Pectinophora gossypiella TaxID=13191 RepID=A0A1E1WIF9_PECGO
MLQEICRISIQITKLEEVYLTWHNSILSVRTDKGVQLFELKGHLQGFHKGIDYVSTLIPTTKSSPLTELVPPKLLKKGVRNIDLTEMLVDQSLWPHNQSLVHEMANVADFKWSPRGMLYNNECAVAILNNVGNIEIFGSGRCACDRMLNLSQVIKQHYISNNVIGSNPIDFEELKKVANIVETSAFSWGPKVVSHSCILTTAQRNGNILFWLLQHEETEMKARCLGEIQTDFGEVITMVWIQKSDNNFVIIFSNSLGQIFALDCILEDTVKVVNKSCIWSYKDKMVTKYICYNIVDNNIVLICNKHRHLLGLLIDKNFNVLSQCGKNINDYRITDLQTTKNSIYMTTVNCKIYTVDTIITGDNLNIEVTPLSTKESYPSYELYSAASSSNGIIFALGMISREIKHRKTPLNIDIIFTADFEHTSEMNMLLENPTKKLTDYWDCIALLRHKMLKLKYTPPVNLQRLYQEGYNDIYKSKLYLIILSFYDVLGKQGKYIPNDIVPEASIEVVRDRIQMLHACQLVNELLQIFKKSEKMLDNIELESYIGAKKYIENYCVTYEKDVLEFLSEKALNLTDTELKYICQCCDEEIQGFSCKNKHLNMFCSLTFTPIENDDYLVCKDCSCLARIELYKNDPMCVFCDLYLNNVHLPKLNSEL